MDIRCEACGKCCYETEMILSERDIERILQNPYFKTEKEDFVIKGKEGFYRLKNKNGHCVFLNSDSIDKECLIYNYRPRGCRFYPMLYDPYHNKCVLDRECPNKKSFYTNAREYKKICQKLKEFLKKELL